MSLGWAVAPCARPSDVAAPPGEALASITKEEVEADVRYLASPELEGRDTPSRGLDLAQQHVAATFIAAGLSPAPDSGAAWRRGAGSDPLPNWARVRPPSDAGADVETGAEGSGERSAGADDGGDRSETLAVWLRPYRKDKLLYDRITLSAPKPEECALTLTGADGVQHTFTYGADFVPLDGFGGKAEGELEFAGFGIENKAARYDDFRGLDLRGKIVAIVSGEPEHKRLFDGPEVTAEAAVWNKLDALSSRGAAGALVIRRTPPLAKGEAAPELAYRWTRASWVVPTTDRVRRSLPTLEVDAEAAARLLGFDALEWAAKVDRAGKPQKGLAGKPGSRPRIELSSATRAGAALLTNLVGYLPGSDPALAGECVVVGAHLDHIGVGPRERIGYGADDNASGTAALMEVVEAMALARPARSVWFVGFSAEEDGLVGSQAFVEDLPMPREQVVAMVNLDMIGRGATEHVVALGFQQNPEMRAVVARAQRLGRSGVTKLQECSDEGLFQRSDHHSFHTAGIPTVFFFENYPLEQNRDYHTWRDVPDLVNFEKVRNTARLAFLTTWVLANQRERLARPR
ncbi:MAG: M28 family peptidase [Planctomycetota bacterium]